MEYFGIRVQKQYLNFSSAHFVIFGPGDREPLHGHNYCISAELEGHLTENRDLFIDFLDIKPVIRRIGDSLDHKVLLPRDNPELEIAFEGKQVLLTFSGRDHFSIPKHDVLILPLPNTTSELLAKYLFERIIVDLSEGYPEAELLSATVYVEETAGQAACYVRKFEHPQRLQELALQYSGSPDATGQSG